MLIYLNLIVQNNYKVSYKYKGAESSCTMEREEEFVLHSIALFTLAHPHTHASFYVNTTNSS